MKTAIKVDEQSKPAYHVNNVPQTQGRRLTRGQVPRRIGHEIHLRCRDDL